MTNVQTLADLRILLVEDEYLQADDTRAVLESHGACVLGPYPTPSDAAEALILADCALIDINLGTGPDFAAARMLRAEGVPFAFLTGYDRELLPAEYRQQTYLQKPVASDRLVETVSALARTARLESPAA